jgi:hypothetical protein
LMGETVAHSKGVFFECHVEGDAILLRRDHERPAGRTM